MLLMFPEIGDMDLLCPFVMGWLDVFGGYRGFDDWVDGMID